MTRVGDVAGRGDERLVVDIDSFVGETFGPRKQGAAFADSDFWNNHSFDRLDRGLAHLPDRGRSALPSLPPDRPRLSDHADRWIEA